MKTWYYVIAFAAAAYLVAAASGGKSGQAQTTRVAGEEKAAEPVEADGPEAWFSEDPEYPRNPNTKQVSVDELLVPHNGGMRAENVVAFTADVHGRVNGPRLALASVDGKYWAYLGVEGKYPRFSPDGTKIVYTSDPDRQLCVITADGSGKRALGQGEWPFLSGSGFSVTASGQEVAFEKDRGIYVINVDGSGLRRVTGPSEENEYAGDVAPAFSPDGSKIAFCSGDVGCDDDQMTFDVYVVNADGTRRRNLTADDGRDWYPSFSHDGKRIVFYSWKRGITVADVETFELRPLPHTGGTSIMEDMTPCFSPDDRKIAYDPEVVPTGTRQIYVINADGTNDTWLSPGGKVHYQHPSFSPVRVDGVLLDTYGRVIEE